jgi:phage protein U
MHTKETAFRVYEKAHRNDFELIFDTSDETSIEMPKGTFRFVQTKYTGAKQDSVALGRKVVPRICFKRYQLKERGRACDKFCACPGWCH